MPCKSKIFCWGQCHTFLGTVTYMSPERINSEPYSFPSDIWSVPRLQKALPCALAHDICRCLTL